MAKKIKEQIDYGDTPERMDPSLERKISSPESPFAANPAFRKGEKDVQRLMTNRFKQVADKLRDVTGRPIPTVHPVGVPFGGWGRSFSLDRPPVGGRRKRTKKRKRTETRRSRKYIRT